LPEQTEDICETPWSESWKGHNLSSVCHEF